MVQFFFGLKVLNQFHFSVFPFVSYYNNESETKENKIILVAKNAKPKKNLISYTILNFIYSQKCKVYGGHG